ncbi:MAG: putative Ig domain-containing protein [Limisphaerales bacterium]
MTICLFTENSTVTAQTRVSDIFGRSLNQHGITLVDWDGYLANPLIKFDLLPPTNAALPGSVTLTADGARLYFEASNEVSSNGPSMTVYLNDLNTPLPVRLSIFPDRDGLDENYTLTLVFTDANNARQTNTVPIHVIDQDLQRTNDFVVTVNFDRDITGVFTNATRRALTTQAANDWAYFFAGLNLDAVSAGTEQTYIWSNNFDGGYYFTSTNSYKGYLLYAYGTINDTHRSGGEGNFNGTVQTSGGTPLTMKRSGGFESEIYGNYNTLGWLFLTNDNDWLVTGNLGDETNDFYSIAHHEIGHALMFNVAHPGFNDAKNAGEFSSAAVMDYYGGPVAIDAVDHLDGAIDPESGQGAFGYEYYGDIPRKRWIPTKLDLLCAQEVGYVLRLSSAFAPLNFLSNSLPVATVMQPYSAAFIASGGIPFYDWDIIDGTLPPGLALDSYSGALTGIPTTNGVFNFTVRVRDYHEAGPELTQGFTLNVGISSPPRLTISITNNQTRILLSSIAGQQQVVQVSNNLLDWTPVATNSSGTNLFQFIESNPLQFPKRFYRAVVIP